MAKHGFGSFLPFLAPLALAAPFVAPELGAALGIGAGAEAGAAGAGALADVGAAAAPEAITAGAAPLAGAGAFAGAAPDISLGLDVTAPAIGGLDAGTAAALSPGLLAPAIDAGSQALPSAASAIGDVLPGTVGSMPGPAAGSTVNTLASSLQPVGPTAAIDPPGFGAPATDIPGGAAELGGADFSGGDTGGGFFNGVNDWVKQNEGLLKGVGAATSLGTLGYNILNAPKYPTGPTTGQIPGGVPLSAAAGTAGTNAANLMAGANQLLQAPLTGALPAGAESAIASSTDAAKAEIRSKFAAMGIPAGSSMEAEALATADQQAGVQRLQEAQTLANQGIQEANLGAGESQLQGGELTNLMNTSVQLALARQAGLSNALANFSRALAGPAVGSGAGTTTVTLPAGTQVA